MKRVCFICSIERNNENRTQIQTIVSSVQTIELTSEQAKAILDNYKILEDKIKPENAKYKEEIYHDYCVSPELFIGYSKTKGYGYMNFWIRGRKYTVPRMSIISELEKFLKS